MKKGKRGGGYNTNEGAPKGGGSIRKCLVGERRGDGNEHKRAVEEKKENNDWFKKLPKWWGKRVRGGEAPAKKGGLG